ncbi:MAG: hypothetical protein K2X39_09065 [Silvanigrellaceae bacterium]|nr:hypothetical protein [Silvanigrellaceae bacterium]
MSTKILDKIKKAENKRQDILLQLLEKKEMVRGSFCQIYVKCGNKNCACAIGKGHSHKRMSWHEKGKSFSRAVPKEDYDWIQQMTNNFREYRKMRKELLKIEAKIRDLLDLNEESVLKKSRKGKSYLEVWKSSVSEVKHIKGSEMTKI